MRIEKNLHVQCIRGEGSLDCEVGIPIAKADVSNLGLFLGISQNGCNDDTFRTMQGVGLLQTPIYWLLVSGLRQRIIPRPSGGN